MAPKKSPKKSGSKKKPVKSAPKKMAPKRKAPVKKTISQEIMQVEKKIGNEIKKEVHFFTRNIENFEHSIHFDVGRGLFAAVAFMVISQTIRWISKTVTGVYYDNVSMANLWSRFVLDMHADPLAFTGYTMLAALGIGFLYAFLYHMVRVSIHGHAPHQAWVKGLLYGIFLVFVTSVPMALHQYIYLNLPHLLIIAWFAESIFVNLISGMAIAVIIK